ncbi:MAG: hypothetical protein GX224_04475 [Thermoplasmatales archaeon]|nr:hypothetical protein [Thermoplasmatales archaeon]
MRTVSVPVTTHIEVLVPFEECDYGYSDDTCYRVEDDTAVATDVSSSAASVLYAGTILGPVAKYLLSLMGFPAEKAAESEESETVSQ